MSLYEAIQDFKGLNKKSKCNTQTNSISMQITKLSLLCTSCVLSGVLSQIPNNLPNRKAAWDKLILHFETKHKNKVRKYMFTANVSVLNKPLALLKSLISFPF